MKKLAKFCSLAMARYGDKLYFADKNSNAIYSLQNGEAYLKIAGQFKKERSSAENLYTDIVVGNGILFCVPHDACTMGIYDIKTENCINVELPEKIRDIPSKFKKGFFYENQIYLIGYGVKNIWEYDIANDNWIEIEIPDSPGLFVSWCIQNGNLYIVSKSAGYVWKIKLMERIPEKIQLEINTRGWADISAIPSGLVLTSFDGKRVYHINENAVERSWNINLDFSAWPHGCGAVGDDGNYYLISKENDGLFIVNLYEQTVKNISLTKDKSHNSTCTLVVSGQYVFILSLESSQIIKFDILTEKSSCIELMTEQTPDIDLKSSRGTIIRESTIFPLDNFLSKVAEQ